MTDAEIVMACAEAMELGGYVCDVKPDGSYRCFVPADPEGEAGMAYDPLHDDAQAMALVKKFRLNIGQLSKGWCKVFTMPAERGIHEGESQDLNRAICECVAKMQKAKHG